MKQLTMKIGDVSIEVNLISEGWRNLYKVAIKNDNRKRVSFELRDSALNSQKGEFINEELTTHIVELIQVDYFVNSDKYPSYYDYAYDYGYERFDKSSDEYKDGKDIYKSHIKFGDKLKRVISEEWIENMKVVKKLSR